MLYGMDEYSKKYVEYNYSQQHIGHTPWPSIRSYKILIKYNAVPR